MSGPQAILAEMMAQVNGMADSKAKAGAGLTPVGAEPTRPAPTPQGQLPGAGTKDWTAGSPIPNFGVGSRLEDDPDLIEARIRNARREVEGILASLDRLAALWANGGPEAGTVVGATEHGGQDDVVIEGGEMPLAEFEEKFAELSKRAQAEVFPTPANYVASDDGKPILVEQDDPAEDVVAIIPDWVCPDHGANALLLKTSPKGRQYLKCTAVGCAQFQK